MLVDELVDVHAKPTRHLFECAAQQHHRIGRRDPDFGSRRELILARPEFHFHGLQRQAERHDTLAQDIKNWRDLIVAALGEVLIAMRRVAHERRLGRPVERISGKSRIFYLEQVKLNLEASHIIETGLGKFTERIAAKLPGSERDLLAVGKIAVT